MEGFDEDEVVIKRAGHVVMLFPRRFAADDLRALLDETGPIGIQRADRLTYREPTDALVSARFFECARERPPGRSQQPLVAKQRP